jgi:hypothetical protein
MQLFCMVRKKTVDLSQQDYMALKLLPPKVSLQHYNYIARIDGKKRMR